MTNETENLVTLPDTQAAYEQASEWLALLDKYEGNQQAMPDSEKRALQHWLAADEAHQRILFEMAQLWDKMDALSRLSDLFADKRSGIKTSRPLAIAASVLLAGFIGLFSFNLTGDRFWGGDSQALIAASNGLYQTAIGEHSTVTLSDGSQLKLNTNTQVTVSYTASERLIHLRRGEVNVSVAKDASRPLSVLAGSKYIQAVGTEFNIEISSEQNIELIVTEGKVRVGVHDANIRQPSNIAQVNNGESGSVLLNQNGLAQPALTVSAGEELMLGSTQDKQISEAVVDVTPEDIEVRLSWQRGNLVFTGEPLGEAVKEVGRYTSVEFVFLDEDLKKVRVAGLFKAGDVDGLLAALRENFNIVSQRVDDQKVLLSAQAAVDPQ